MPLVYIPDEVFESGRAAAMMSSLSAESSRASSYGRRSGRSARSTRSRSRVSIPRQRPHNVASHNNRHENRQSRSEARGYQQAMGSTYTSGRSRSLYHRGHSYAENGSCSAGSAHHTSKSDVAPPWHRRRGEPNTLSTSNHCTRHEDESKKRRREERFRNDDMNKERLAKRTRPERLHHALMLTGRTDVLIKAKTLLQVPIKAARQTIVEARP